MTDAMLLGLTIAGGSAAAVLGALLIFAGLTRHRTPPVFSPEIEDHDAVFIFSGDVLVDCSDRGRKLLDDLRALHSDPLEALLIFVQPHFRDLRARLADLTAVGRLDLMADDASGLSLSAQSRAGLIHLRLIDPNDEGALMAMDRLSFQAMDDELRLLRELTSAAPVVIWRENAQGQVIWANDAYLDTLSAKADGHPPLSWPLPVLFDRAGQTDSAKDRLMVDLTTGPRWFAHHVHAQTGGTLHFATPIDSTVQSELARREMMQMLTRTFASLPIGLALFDAERRLQVFNPALVDLTGLDPFFLAARPDLAQFLHTLRELRMLPEPKDFSTWRDELIRMETAAASGTYNEEWLLQDGSIYKVTGCPQPNGALAFFIQDITSEATLLRGVRAEMEFNATVLDALPDAVIAFDRNGAVILANATYRQLWGNDPCVDLADGGFAEATALWAAACDPGPALIRLSDYAVHATRDAPLFSATTMLRNGGPVAIQATHLHSGGLMICFRPLRADSTTPIRRSLNDLVGTHILSADLASPQAAPLPEDLPVLAALPLRPRNRNVRHTGTRLRV
jgi:PAS domain-containing protein